MIHVPRLFQRVSALALAVGLVGAVWLTGLEPVKARVSSTRAQIAANEELMERYAERMADSGIAEMRVAEITQSIQRSGFYVRAETEPLAAAKVQENLRRIVAQSGGELKSVQSLQSEDVDGLVRIGLRVLLQGEYEALITIMHDLEAREPLMFMDNVKISAAARRQRSRTVDVDVTFSLVFDLYGFLEPNVRS